MRRWVEKVGPEKPAQELFALMTVAADAQVIEAIDANERRSTLGSVAGALLASDSILVYAVDDSWASLSIVSDFAATLVEAGLVNGIPLRGAISVGEVVIDRDRDLYVGLPLGDAYESDHKHRYRGVGVHVTARTVAALADRVHAEPPPLYLLHGYTEALFRGAQARGERLVWFGESLFVDHWGPEYLAGTGDLEEARAAIARFDASFGARGLPENADVELKRLQSREFLMDRFRRRSESRQTLALPMEVWIAGWQTEMQRLLAIGLRDRAGEPGPSPSGR